MNLESVSHLCSSDCSSTILCEKFSVDEASFRKDLAEREAVVDARQLELELELELVLVLVPTRRSRAALVASHESVLRKEKICSMFV